MAKSKRTVLRSRSGKKLYAVRDASGKFKDIQSYARAHAADLRRTSAAEAAGKVAKKKKAKKKAAKKAKAPAKKK
jgi:hypothetical protein